MSQEDTTSESPSAPDPAAASTPGEAWREVVTQIEALGTAVGTWTRAAIDDPQNRQRAAEIRTRLEGVAAMAADSVDQVTKTEVGSAVVDTAEKTGQAIVDAGGKVADAAAPHVANALSGLAGMFGKAAERVERASQPREQEASDAEEAATPAGTAEPGDPSGDAPGQ